MNYFMVSTMPYVDPDFCFLRKPLKGVDSNSFKISRGIPIAAEYPADAYIEMAEEDPGIKLPSLIGNTDNFFIVDDALKEIVESIENLNVEYLPLTIKNHKGKDVEKSYWILNPLDFVDCLDLEASKIKFRSNGDVARVKKRVLDAEKLEDAVDLFRIPQDPTNYIISQKLAELISQAKPTNFTVDTLEVS